MRTAETESTRSQKSGQKSKSAYQNEIANIFRGFITERIQKLRRDFRASYIINNNQIYQLSHQQDFAFVARRMNSNKRRQVIKNSKQTQIQFPQTKNSIEAQAQRQEFAKKFESQSYIYDYQSGAKESQATFRSVNRVNSLLKKSPYMAQHGCAKLMEDYSKMSPQFISKPSSATTACTFAASEYSMRTDLSSLAKNKRDLKSDRKSTKERKLVGQKRQAQMQLDQMEYFARLSSSAARHIVQNLRLRDKKTGQVFEFSLLSEDQILGFRNNPTITDFDMTKLEVEYDYDTDEEQQTQSKKMLLHELCQAIEFFIKEDPLKLVDNIML